MTSRRPAPADWGGRIDRVEQIEASNATAESLALLGEVLRYQRRRAEEPEVASAVAAVSHEVLARRLVGDWPLLDVTRCADTVSVSVGDVVGSLDRPDAPVPAPLRDAGRELSRMTMEERADAVEMWLDDPGLVHPQFAFWLRAAAAPVLETAAAKVEPPSKERWSRPVCPFCLGPPEVSVIGEESGEFMAGSPRYLACARCASPWSFPRARCISCGEEDSRRLSTYTAEGVGPARIDACDSCGAYIKTFDLREPGGRDIVPLVDDVATMALDLWAHEQGWHRPSLSLAGV